jgi:CO dehydrogenase/acetyl-CoA synthase beta subunit
LRYKKIKEILDNFLKRVQLENKDVNVCYIKESPLDKSEWKKIRVHIDNYKDIVLESDTGLELGGINKTSFSLIYPIKTTKNTINTNKIIIIGPEINELNSSKTNFGLFILLTIKNLSEKLFENLRNFSFISNGIEGFAIRSIPRRFWCRISQNSINKKFSFQFLGNAIISLYKQKFGKEISSIEILMITESSKLINKFLEHTAEISNELNNRWKVKVDNWKKRIDCDYEWACEICPYFKSCKSLQEILEERKNLEI